MQLEKAFTYWYKDPKWMSKMVIAALISLVPILSFAFFGYINEIIRRVTRDDTEPLPLGKNLARCSCRD